jgi:uncharacterized membrane protein
MERSNNVFGGINISGAERWASTLVGGALMAYGLKRRSLGGTLIALGAGSLVCRGATGHCLVYKALGLNTSETKSGVASVRHNEGVKIEASVTIDKSPGELYRFWRNFENLPRFMTSLESVKKIDDKHSHWVVKAPAGTTLEWGAEIHNEKENEFIAWRSLQNAELNNAGSVHFTPSLDGRGTTVKVILSYEPPGGKLGHAIAKFLGHEPERQIREDLWRLKDLMEADEIAPPWPRSLDPVGSGVRHD